jgi:hypothetical protein
MRREQWGYHTSVAGRRYFAAEGQAASIITSNFVEKVSEQSGAFYFLLRLGSLMEEPSFY